MNNSEKDLETIKNKKSILTVRRVITFKTQMIILPDGKDIVDIVAGEPGPKSDITYSEKIAALSHNKNLRRQSHQGEDLITTPIKKQRNRELTSEQNRKIKHFRFAEFLSNIELGQSKVCPRQISVKSKEMSE